MTPNEQISKAIAFVHADDGAEQSSLGIALLVDAKGNFLTCAHVVEERQTVTLRTLDGGQHVADVVTYPEVDLATLHIRTGSVDGLRPCPILATSEIADCYLHVLLDPAGGELTPHQMPCAAGSVSTVRYLIGDTIRTIAGVYSLPSIEISNGHSGAPIWSPRHSAVVGLAAASRSSSAIATFLIPFSHRKIPDQIRLILRGNNNDSVRVGISPNGRGLRVLARLARRRSSKAMRRIGLFDEARTIPRLELNAGLEEFSAQIANPLLAIVSGSGLGKTSGIFQWLTKETTRTIFFARGVTITSPRDSIWRLYCSDAKETVNLEEGDGNSKYLIVDGLNEAACPYEALANEWLPTAVAEAQDKGFRLIVTMRPELWAFAKKSVALEGKFYQPKLDRPEEASTWASGAGSNPCLVLGLFNRKELASARKLYAANVDLPDSILAHPFLLKLAARANSSAAPISNRYELLDSYLSTKITSLSRSVNLLESDVVRILGQDVSDLGHLDSRIVRLSTSQIHQKTSLLRACVAESLIEETETGYRYVFDYFFDYFLMRWAWSRFLGGEEVVKVFSLLTAEAIGLAIERADGANRAELAVSMEATLRAMAMSPEYSQQKLALDVLSKVRGGSRISDLKDDLVERGAFSQVFAFGFVISFESFDLGPYAWSERQALALIARMIEQEQDYGWRPQDLGMPERGNYASNKAAIRQLFSDYQSLSLDFFDVLVAKLADSKVVGREATVGSFHAHVLAALADKFGVGTVIDRVVELDTAISRAIIVRTAVDYPEFVHQCLGRVIQKGLAGTRAVIVVLLAFAELRRGENSGAYPTQTQLLALIPLLLTSPVSLPSWVRCFDWREIDEPIRRQLKSRVIESLTTDPYSASEIWDCFVPDTISAEECLDAFEGAIRSLDAPAKAGLLRDWNPDLSLLGSSKEQREVIERVLSIFDTIRSDISASREGQIIESFLYMINQADESVGRLAAHLLKIDVARLDGALREVAFFAFNSRNASSKLARKVRFYVLRKCTSANWPFLLSLIVSPRGSVTEPREFTQQLELAWLLRRMDSTTALERALAGRALGVHRGKAWWAGIVGVFRLVLGGSADILVSADG